MSFCSAVLVPAAFPAALISLGLWLPPCLELGAGFGLEWDQAMGVHPINILWVLHVVLAQHLPAWGVTRI